MSDRERPVRLIVRDDLQRSRATVVFRLPLALVHLIWFLLWANVVLVTAFAQWVITVVRGRPAAPLHSFHVHFIRFSSHLTAYLTLAANPLPSLLGDSGYPVDIEVDPAESQSRLSTTFRLLLAFPALVAAGLVTLGSPNSVGGIVYVTGGLLVTSALLAWFASLVRGATPHGLRNLAAYAVRYVAEVSAYLLLVTRTYPSLDPTLPANAGAPPAHPVRVVVEDDRRRSRLTTFFRLFLAVPHVFWLLLWAPFALLAAIGNWFFTLLVGRAARPLHRFLAAWVAYQAHFGAFLLLVANPFPGFTGARGYPLDVVIDPPERQRRLTTAFRLLLALPAWLINSALTSLLLLGSIGIWFAALVLGRAPEGLRNIGAHALRYSAQVNAYAALLTDRYPYSGPPVFETEAAPADQRAAV